MYISLAMRTVYTALGGVTLRVTLGSIYGQRPLIYGPPSAWEYKYHPAA